MTIEHCSTCDGRGMIEQKLKNLGTLNWDWHWVSCPVCEQRDLNKTKGDLNDIMGGKGL